jgi:hypothetical protein
MKMMNGRMKEIDDREKSQYMRPNGGQQTHRVKVISPI